MSAGEKKENGAPPPPPPPPEPDADAVQHFVERVEFWRAIEGCKRETAEQSARLMEEFGIVLFSLAIWCAFTAFFLLKDARR